MNQRPNILLLIFDSLGESDLARHAHELPNLTKLRKKSVDFTNAYAPSPESGPARASLFTGLDMAAHGVWTDGVPLPDHEITLPERFAGAGYHTWLVGRRQLAGVSNWTTEHARPYEYAHFDWAHGPLHRSRQNTYLKWLEETQPDRYDAIFPKQADPDETDVPQKQREAMNALPCNLSFSQWLAKRVSKRISERPANRPFFGVAGFVVGNTMGAPHRSGPCLERTDRKALMQADQAVGDILDTVKDVPNQIVVLVSGRGSLASKDTRPLQRDALRVPLLFSSKDHLPTHVDGAVSTMDLAPTLYEIATVPPPPRMQGRSLLTEAPRGWALARMRSSNVPQQTALTSDRWKLVVTHGGKDDFLFDLEADPFEKTNLADDPANRGDLEAMIDMMIDARVALEDRTEPRVALF